MKTTFIALRLFVTMTLLTGVVYPLCITGASQVLFKHQAEGSLLIDKEQVLGSELIGQNFKDPKYFWPRPSAIDYNPLPSSGSNLGPTSADLVAQFNQRKQTLEKTSPSSKNNPIPEDLLFASGSGLDPHISPAAAQFQIARIISVRGLTGPQIQQLSALIDTMTEDRSFGILGEKRINVLKLNIELERNFPKI